MTIQIDKGIPVPAHNKKYAKKYPFQEMEIGDSFLMPLPDGKSPGSLYAAMSGAKKRFNINLTAARVDGGVRVWRIAPALSPPHQPDVDIAGAGQSNFNAKSVVPNTGSRE